MSILNQYRTCNLKHKHLTYQERTRHVSLTSEIQKVKKVISMGHLGHSNEKHHRFKRSRKIPQNMFTLMRKRMTLFRCIRNSKNPQKHLPKNLKMHQRCQFNRAILTFHFYRLFVLNLKEWIKKYRNSASSVAYQIFLCVFRTHQHFYFHFCFY